MRSGPPMRPPFCPARLIRPFLVAAAIALPATAAHAQAGPSFGDSGWVAPLPAGALDADWTAPGPRVAGRDREPVGETILRTPFRVAFLPLRLLGRGLEAAAGPLGGQIVAQRPVGRQAGGLRIGPTFGYAGGPGPALGLKVLHSVGAGQAPPWSVSGTWSLRDTRRAAAVYRHGTSTARWGVVARATYGLRPNQRFYGIGNSTNEADRSIYLGETGAANVAVRYGPLARHVRLLAGWQSTSARRGWNDGPGLLDVFAPAQAPGMLDHTSYLSFGAGGDYAAVDDLRDPSAGVHFRAAARRFAGDAADFNRFDVEARGYLPVFSARRVLAVRALHQGVHPADSAGPLPFYLLPEAADVGRFAGYAAHRFMDRHLALAHIEYRWLIWDRLWALGLAEVGAVAPSAAALRLADGHESYGGGLRFAFSTTSVARLQVAKGNEGISAYVTFKEDF